MENLEQFEQEESIHQQPSSKKKYLLAGIALTVIIVGGIGYYILSSSQQKQDSKDTQMDTTLIENEVDVRQDPKVTQIKTTLGEDNMFEFLTKNRWQDAGCGQGGLLAPTCTTVEFRKNGNFSWTAFSDYPERGQSGKWNLRLTEENAGIVYLSDGSVISFMREGDDLGFTISQFMPAEDIVYELNESQLTRDDLSIVEPSETYNKLIANPWEKSNDFDLFRIPESIVFKENGRFFASYRDGQCSHGGFWSLDHGAIPHLILIPFSDTNDCDLRGYDASIAASNEWPRFQDELLIFYSSSYYNAEERIRKKVFSFDSYSGSVRVTGEYDGTFTRGVPVSVDFMFENVTDREMELGKFEIAMQNMKLVKGGLGRDGEEVVLLTKDYTGINLPPGKDMQDQFTIIPSVSGEYVYFTIRLDFKDVRQSYGGYESYIVGVD